MSSSLNLDVYQQLANGEYQLPSVYLAAAKERVEPSESLILKRLEKVLARQDVMAIHKVEKDENGFRVVLLGQDEQEFIFRLSFEDNVDNEMWHYDSPEYANRNLFEDERIEMHQSPQTVECFTYLDLDYPQTYAMVQLAVLDAVAGECYAVCDPISTLYFSGTWLAEMAQTHAAISPEMHYVIHAITPTDPEATPDDYWLHTHGLLKFGLPELEILKAHQDNIYTCQHLINAAAMQLFAKPHLWQEDDVLAAYGEEGYVNIAFKPWQEAIISDLVVEKKGFFSKKTVPFSGDMSDREDIHSEPSMAIFAYLDEQVRPLSAYGDLLHNDKHFMKLLPDEETSRMAALANEKFALLARCFTQNPPSESWTYLIKFACHSESSDETEHMWFNLQELAGENVRAELINTPFNIPEMKAETVYDMPLERMTDWVIYSEVLGKIDPDNAFQLRRYLNRH